LQYARDRMDGLGYDEHPDALNFENIPSTDFDTTYHVELLPFVRQDEDLTSVTIGCPMVVRVFQKLLRETNEHRDEVVVIADTIADDFIAAQNRLGTDIKTVQFDRMNIEQLADSNDNAVILVMEFTAVVVKSTGRTGG